MPSRVSFPVVAFLSEIDLQSAFLNNLDANPYATGGTRTPNTTFLRRVSLPIGLLWQTRGHGRIRTCDLRFRRAMFSPTELRTHLER